LIDPEDPTRKWEIVLDSDIRVVSLKDAGKVTKTEEGMKDARRE